MKQTKCPRVLVVLGTSRVFGRERSNVQVFRFLREAGYEVLFVTAAARSKEVLEPFISEHGFKSRPISLDGVFSKGMSIRLWALKLWSLLSGGIEFHEIVREFRPTHIHISGVSDFIAIWFGLIMTNTPVIYRLGDSPQQKPAVYRWLWRWLLKPRVAKFVCISNYIKNRLDALEGDANVQVIYNFPPERVSCSGSRSNDKRSEYVAVLYLGQIVRQKGVALFVEAACDLCRTYTNAVFIVAGPLDQDKEYGRAVIRLIEERGLSDRFKLLGHVDDVYSLLGNSDLHVMPSICTEALGNVVIEAKSVGIPSVVFPMGGTPELIEHAVDGFVCSDTTVVALKQGIEFFLKDPVVRTRAGHAASASLERLGITKEGYVRSWRLVYEAD
jgi:glycosyltransferase involved in cell wall biosynthesis